MDGPGTITWDEFIKNAQSFIGVSDEISDCWKLHGDKNTPAEAYLARQVKTFVTSDYFSGFQNEGEKELLSEDHNEITDPFEACSESSQVPLILEHHVIWSMSYGVPILLFNGWFSDFPGINPVSVESAQKLVHHDNLGYGELSQSIHPILGTTFLQLHPCMSKELIRNTSKSKNKLVSWLSTVAPAALNLKLKNEYFQLTQTDESVGNDGDGRNSPAYDMENTCVT